MSSGQYITIANVDDIPAPNHLKTLVKHLNNNPDVDLVYADCFNSSIPNDVFSVDKKLPLYEHSKGVFSPAAMIKCLPGPMPLWRKSLHDKIGMFDERFKFVSDWEFWLRAVEAGSKFLKVNKVLGIYYHNPAGLTTNLAYNKEKREEEKQVFEKYKNVFGEQIYNQYKGYFTNV
jgi:GT2 family glycosyltransferase